MAYIYLVRHGQASFGSQNYDQLSETGKLQATTLGQWWAERDMKIARVVTGSMQRHRETAEACLTALHNLPLHQLPPVEWQSDAGFNEYHHHEVLARHVPAFDDPTVVKRFLIDTPNGKQRFQTIFAEAIERWVSGKFDHDYTETWQDFRSRCIVSLERQIEQAERNQHIVIFTSGGTISVLCQHLFGFSDQKFAELQWSLVNAGVTRLHVQAANAPERHVPLALGYLNNFAHLEALNRAELITYV